MIDFYALELSSLYYTCLDYTVCCSVEGVKRNLIQDEDYINNLPLGDAQCTWKQLFLHSKQKINIVLNVSPVTDEKPNTSPISSIDSSYRYYGKFLSSQDCQLHCSIRNVYDVYFKDKNGRSWQNKLLIGSQ